MSHRRVIWYEGMTLDPQHLQQADAHTRALVAARVRALSRYDWGLLQLAFDRDRLPNGELALLTAVGVLPDGLVVNVPEQDAAPSPRAVAEAFPATADRRAVFLAVPSERAGEPNVQRVDPAAGGRNGASERRELRFSSTVVTTPDENAGGEMRPIEVAAPNFQLRFEGEPMEGYTTLRVAEVVRTPGGAFAFDDAFIPTALRLAAAPPLAAAAQRLQELLVAQRAVLGERRPGLLRKPQLSPADVAALHLYEVVCGALPRVAHVVEGPGGSAEALYLVMAELAARLAAWAPAARLPEIPLYDHADPTACFGRLLPVLWTLLGEAAPAADYVEVPLHAIRPNVYAARTDGELLEQATWFLTVATPDGAEDARLVDLPTRLRVASPQTIDSVLRSATRALPLEEPPKPPPHIPVRAGARVLAFQKRGPFWEAILQDDGIAVYVPAEMGQLDLKLLAVLKT